MLALFAENSKFVEWYKHKMLTNHVHDGLTLDLHALRDALLEATMRASFTAVLLHDALLVRSALVLLFVLDRTLEEALKRSCIVKQVLIRLSNTRCYDNPRTTDIAPGPD